MKNFSRRSFIRSGLAWGGVAFIGSQFIPKFLRAGLLQTKPDIVITSADNPMEAVDKLLEALGGIGKLVKSGDTVGILVNSPWKNPGYFTNPDVALAGVKQCLEAGAKEIVCFKPVPDGYWEKSRYFGEMATAIGKIRYCEARKKVTIPGAVYLKEADIFEDFVAVDTYINIPVAKHHAGTNFSGTLKGLMGVSSSETNRFMHSANGDYTYDEQEYLSQCVADLNLLRQPDLSVVDAIECGLNNGPRGPGETVKPNKIIAGTDMVAVDAYSSNLIGFSADEVRSIAMAAKHGLGKNDLKALSVLEV
jgi:uncharacterized protein (DUF362 family)